VGEDDASLVLKCEELLEILYANGEHAKLRALVADIEALRDRLLSGPPASDGEE
jgi:hypothetical protein